MPTPSKFMSTLAMLTIAAAYASAALGAASVSGTISKDYPQPMPRTFSPMSGPPGTVVTVNGQRFQRPHPDMDRQLEDFAHSGRQRQPW